MVTLPGAQNLPQRSARGGGGVPSVPNVPAPDIGGIADEAFNFSTQLMEAEKRVQARQAQSGRNSDLLSMEEKTSRILNAAQNDPNRDLSTTEGQVQTRLDLDAVRDSILKAHRERYGDDSALDLMDQLNRVYHNGINTIVQTSNDIIKKRRDTLIDRRVGNGSSRLAANPAAVPDEIRNLDDFLDTQKDLSPMDRTIYRQAGVQSLVESAVLGFKMQKDIAGGQAIIDQYAAQLGSKKVNELMRTLGSPTSEPRFLSEDEKAAIGAPPGMLIARTANGFQAVYTPPKETKEKPDAKEKQIERLVKQHGWTREMATAYTDGLVKLTVRNVDGRVILTDMRDANNPVSKEIEIDPADLPIPERPQKSMSLFDMARSSAIAGIGPNFEAQVWDRIWGQAGGKIDVGLQVMRSEYQGAMNGLIRAFSLNPRYPIAEQNRIREEIDIKPKAFDTQLALMGRMLGIKNSLMTRAHEESMRGSDPNMDPKTRSEARSLALSIQQFIQRLGVPEDATIDNLSKYLPPKGVPDWSRFVGYEEGTGHPIWQAPDGSRYRVRQP